MKNLSRLLLEITDFNRCGCAARALFSEGIENVFAAKDTKYAKQLKEQTLFTGRTRAEGEFVAASDTLVFSEQHDFLDFYSPLPTSVGAMQNSVDNMGNKLQHVSAKADRAERVPLLQKRFRAVYDKVG